MPVSSLTAIVHSAADKPELTSVLTAAGRNVHYTYVNTRVTLAYVSCALRTQRARYCRRRRSTAIERVFERGGRSQTLSTPSTAVAGLQCYIFEIVACTIRTYHARYVRYIVHDTAAVKTLL